MTTTDDSSRFEPPNSRLNPNPAPALPWPPCEAWPAGWRRHGGARGAHIARRLTTVGVRQTHSLAHIFANGCGRQLRFVVRKPGAELWHHPTESVFSMYGGGTPGVNAPGLQDALAARAAQMGLAPRLCRGMSVGVGGLWDYRPEAVLVLMAWCAERVVEIWGAR